MVAGSSRPAWTEGGLRWARAGSDTPGLPEVRAVAETPGPPVALQSSSVELAADHVDGAEGRDQVGDHLAGDHPGQRGHRREARRPTADPIRPIGAVGDHVESVFSCYGFH